MNDAAGKAPADDIPVAPVSTPPLTADEAILKRESRNFLVLAGFQIVTRTGWIFKTESVVMPAVLSLAGGTGWHLGFLPFLSRLGLSAPPLLAARRMSATPLKKRGLFLSTLGMALTMGIMGAFWWYPHRAGAARGASVLPAWSPTLFLLLYGVFFACTGLHQVIYQTLQGKLILATHRGRLLSASNLFGSAAAIAAALWLLRLWLAAEPPRIDLIFGFAGLCFGGAALLSLLAKEPADAYSLPRKPWRQRFSEGLTAMRGNQSFTRLCAASALAGCSIVLFPHYQELGRGGSGFEANELVLWIVVQNLVTGVFSMFVGPIADSRGNRAALRISLLLLVTLPLTAVTLAHCGEIGRRLFFIVFGLLGLLPVTQRLLNHYALEISDPGDHPRFLSTVNAFQAAPAFLAPVVGGAIDKFHLESVFLAVAAFNILGWLLTWRLEEPRQNSTVV
jgi:hypothetical protein